MTTATFDLDTSNGLVVEVISNGTLLQSLTIKPKPKTTALLLENGSYLLLEDGGHLLGE